MISDENVASPECWKKGCAATCTLHVPVFMRAWVGVFSRLRATRASDQKKREKGHACDARGFELRRRPG